MSTQPEDGTPQYRRLDRREMATAWGVRSGDRIDGIGGYHEAITRAHENLCARAWGLPLPPADTPVTHPRRNGLRMRDIPGSISVVTMRELFEASVRSTPSLASRTRLDPLERDGEWIGYYDTDTDALWIGFAVGMRCAERREREREAGRKGDAAPSQPPGEAGMLPAKPL